jgi:hypothetical protein
VIRLFFWTEGVKTSEVKAEAGNFQDSQWVAEQGFRLRHDNARPHSVATTVEAIRQLIFKPLPHPHMVRY